MNGNKQQSLRRRLEALRDRLRPEVTNLTDQTLSAAGGQAAHELSNAPFHLGDNGTEEYLHDLNATLLENEEFLANEVRAALKRIDDGSYGTCESCGRAIAVARLEAIPYTRYCIKCAENADSGLDVNIDRGRPHNPDDTLAPEGAMGEWRGRDPDSPFTDHEVEVDRDRNRSDIHAVGTPGGGGPHGGLAGSNEGRGDPDLSNLEDSMGSSEFDVEDARDDDRDEPRSGRAGGAVGGTPAGKRAR